MNSRSTTAHPGRRAARPLRFAVSLAVAAGLGLAGCATTGLVRQGRLAEQAQDYDQAVIVYTRALRENPGSAEARTALERARLRAAEQHHVRARRFGAIGRLEEALVEYQLATEFNPLSADIDRELRQTRTALRAKVAAPRPGRSTLESLIERTRDLPPAGLELPSAAKLPSSLVFREASSRDVFTALARFANLSLAFDPAFRETPVTIDFREARFEDALDALSASTRNFWRVTAPRTVTIVPDTPAKRREYEEEVVRTFYLSNADVKETIDLLRIVVDLRRLSATSGANAITVKDTPERIQAAARIISAIDKARPEVVIDVEVLEVDRTRLQEYGIQIASSGSPGIAGTATIDQDGLTLRDLRTLTQTGVFLGSLPSLVYRLLKTDASTRTLANPQLRGAEGLSAQARFGDRVPIPTTTFSPIATGGVAQQPITAFTYENIGVNIDITPRTHHDESVSLALKIEVSSISGTGFGNLPTFGNRSITTVIRLKDGETSILGGLIRDDERQVLEGIPGLSDLPVVGRLFARTRREAQQTDIVLMLTPHIVRVLDLTEEDVRAFRMGRDVGTPFVELPGVDAPPRDPIKEIKEIK